MKFPIAGVITLLILVTFQPGAAQTSPGQPHGTSAGGGNIEQLPEIVVSASRVPQQAKAVGSSVTVITAKEIERKQVRGVSDLLRDVPGVAVHRSGTVGTLTAVRLRGAEYGHALVIIDGVIRCRRSRNTPPAETLARQIERFDDFRRIYNNERPA